MSRHEFNSKNSTAFCTTCGAGKTDPIHGVIKTDDDEKPDLSIPTMQPEYFSDGPPTPLGFLPIVILIIALVLLYGKFG